MQGRIRTRRTASSEPLLVDPEIEKTARRSNSATRRRRAQAQQVVHHSSASDTLSSTSQNPDPLPEEEMADNPHGDGRGRERRTLEDYAAFTDHVNFNSIARPTVNATNMEMKPTLIHLVQSNQFNGLSHENPYTHLTTFLEICNTVKIHQVPDEAIRLSLFSFSLAGPAKAWLNSFPENSLTNWDDVVAKFLSKYFPQSKVNKGKQEISAFQQDMDESLGQAWDRFKGLLRKTPIHGFDQPTQLTLFLAGLKSQSKLMLDASAGGSIKWKTPEEAYELIENMAANDNEAYTERTHSQKKGILELQSQDALLAQNKIMTQQLETLMKKLSQLPQELQNASVAQLQQVQSCELCGGNHTNGQCAMSSTSQEEVSYMGNQGRLGNYNQGWKLHQNMGQTGPSNRPPHQQTYQHPSLTDRTSKLEDMMQQFLQMSIQNQKNTDASIKNLEVQVGQLAKQLADQRGSSFSANTEANPKEQCKAIFTRSGKEVGLEEEVNKREENEKEKKKKEKVVVKPLPYPQNPSRKEKERQLARFKDIFKQFEIKIPFSEALQQISSYAKFMKEFLGKKKKYIEEETIEVQGNCSAIIQKNLPPKFKDPGSFTIPCTIGNQDMGKALVDLGASINLMPLSMLRKIGGLEAKPTRMTLQLADNSIKYPYGVVEDVVVQIDKLKFSVDFVVMEMEKDEGVPLILGRPFMKTAKVVINVDEGTLKLKDQDEEVNFNVFEAVQESTDEETSLKAINEVLSVTSRPWQASKLLGKCSNCFSAKVNEEREEKDDALVHHHSLMGTNGLKPGQPIVMRKEHLKISPRRFKSNWARLWVIRDIKVDGRIEIEAPYSRRTKLVTSDQLKLYRCEVGKEHTKSNNQA
ncbi:uncharacterized protein LOC114184687 [Vigna unguiculata]|uniref:uncharacterized protein LOC114184687 n=1 Tax=Vigna unguiculata TaxID=3917 RepID=UPI001015EA70|nr:uncharacterized protein LOC114184687 [Vigna unguiculata]